MRLWALVIALSAALAAEPSPGWSPGTVAAGTAEAVGGAPSAPIDFPSTATSKMTGPTLVFFFSPTCPHCRHVAAEVEALHRTMKQQKVGVVLGVVSGSATAEEVAEFERTFQTTFAMVVDADRSIQSAMGARSTPSAMLVAPAGKGKVGVSGAWLPFVPGASATVLGRVTGNPFAAFTEGKYLGNGACGTCHTHEYDSWSLTLHAVAWRTLTRSGKDRDPACTSCHVTGSGAPTGWAGEPGSALVNVGCEACHGPGGPHDGVRAEPTETCAACHDAKHSIAFNLGKAVPLIDHFRATAMSPDAYEAARRALYNGEVGQSLVAMPEGKNVGSAACQSCHPTEHLWWSADPHANAMASLRPKGSTDPACVRCHATAKVSGPPPTTLDGFDRLGGVGCESCHGPGEAHVAARGGTTNIVGLGESCPVCVIDAVCTSCHTPEWSPTWNLEHALEAIEHTVRN